MKHRIIRISRRRPAFERAENDRDARRGDRIDRSPHVARSDENRIEAEFVGEIERGTNSILAVRLEEDWKLTPNNRDECTKLVHRPSFFRRAGL